MGSHQRSFERYHPRPPTVYSSSLRLGFATPPKTWIAIISGTGKATDFKCGRYIHSPSEQKLIKNLGEKGAWAYPGTTQIF